MADKEMLAGVRLRFRDIYHELSESSDPSAALEEFPDGLPTAKNTH